MQKQNNKRNPKSPGIHAFFGKKRYILILLPLFLLLLFLFLLLLYCTAENHKGPGRPDDFDSYSNSRVPPEAVFLFRITPRIQKVLFSKTETESWISWTDILICLLRSSIRRITLFIRITPKDGFQVLQTIISGPPLQ